MPLIGSDIPYSSKSANMAIALSKARSDGPLSYKQDIQKTAASRWMEASTELPARWSEPNLEVLQAMSPGVRWVEGKNHLCATCCASLSLSSSSWPSRCIQAWRPKRPRAVPTTSKVKICHGISQRGSKRSQQTWGSANRVTERKHSVRWVVRLILFLLIGIGKHEHWAKSKETCRETLEEDLPIELQENHCHKACCQPHKGQCQQGLRCCATKMCWAQSRSFMSFMFLFSRKDFFCLQGKVYLGACVLHTIMVCETAKPGTFQMRFRQFEDLCAKCAPVWSKMSMIQQTWELRHWRSKQPQSKHLLSCISFSNRR